MNFKKVKRLNIDKKNRTCYFTGHSPQNLPFKFNEESVNCINLKTKIQQTIINLIEEYNVVNFISGVALGVDQYAAEIILELKNHYSGITLECIISFETQSSNWKEAQRNRYFHIIEQCDKETILQYSYNINNKIELNEYIANNSNFIIAVWNEKLTKTAKTIEQAKSLNKYIFIISPITFETIILMPYLFDISAYKQKSNNEKSDITI